MLYNFPHSYIMAGIIHSAEGPCPALSAGAEPSPKDIGGSDITS